MKTIILTGDYRARNAIIEENITDEERSSIKYWAAKRGRMGGRDSFECSRHLHKTRQALVDRLHSEGLLTADGWAYGEAPVEKCHWCEGELGDEAVQDEHGLGLNYCCYECQRDDDIERAEDERTERCAEASGENQNYYGRNG